MKHWKKLLIYSVSLAGFLVIGIAVIMACADEPDPYDYYTSFFHPDVEGKKDYNAFYFTDYRFTYTNDEPASEAAINATEWAQYLGKSVKTADVDEVMYEVDSAGKQRNIRFLAQSSSLPDSLANNTFLNTLKDTSHFAARKYYQFALQAEQMGTAGGDAWSPAPLDTATLKAQANEALQAANNESDSFLKLRYLYQAQKLNHYAENFEEANKIYDDYLVKIPSQSHIKGWALSLKAGEQRRLGDTIRAAYLFAKVFVEYPERRIQAYRNYHYINPPLNEVLKLAQTPREKANLYAIKGFANTEIEVDDLKRVYEYAPESPMVGTLLVREVNKLEQNYLTPKLANNNDQFYSSSANKSIEKLTPTAPTAKWPLILGITVLAGGATLLIYTLKKSTDKRPGNIAAGILMIAGVASIGWYALRHNKQQLPMGQTLPQGSFFVNLPDSVKNKYNEHIEKLRSFCIDLSNDAKYPDPQIGKVINAYLYFMQNRPDDGLKTLNGLQNTTLGPKLTDQKQIINLLLSAQRLKQIKAVDEAALLPSLQWLQSKMEAGLKPKQDYYVTSPDDDNHFGITARNFYIYVLAPAYLRQGDTAKAALALLKSNNGYASNQGGYLDEKLPDFWFNFVHSNHLQQIIKWKQQPQTDRYLSFLSADLKSVDSDKLYDLLGTIELREHHYSEAALAFQRIKSNKERNANYNGESYYDDGPSYQGDPFYAGINDYPKSLTGKRYTKLTFAQKMAALEAQLKAAPQNAGVCYQMANALYNTSTYGNSWGLISYQWSSTDFGRKPMYYFDADYIETNRAKQYYLKARELSTDPELKARCTFMAAKCEQKQHEAPSYLNNYDDYEKQREAYLASLKTNSYYKEMQQYKSTAFYKQAGNECSYLSDFIKSH
ncbi:hypothetical protein [Mucilaginibacter sp. CSA2-8R]|uniref:hypothetical protein n=1 Tax=Mucilaginibacter sp. CSA2-8R TaxID=3141542 RepID=UPI00315D6264